MFQKNIKQYTLYNLQTKCVFVTTRNEIKILSVQNDIELFLIADT